MEITARLTASTPHLFLKNLDALVKASLRNHQTSKEAKSATPPTRTQVVVEGEGTDDILGWKSPAKEHRWKKRDREEITR